MSRRWWILVVVVVGALGLLAGCSSPLTDSQAQLKPQDYGKGAQYQVEISLNCTSAENCTVHDLLGNGAGFGVWLWLELNNTVAPSGTACPGGATTCFTGDYTGADCGHHVPGDPAIAGASPASGDLTWIDDGSGDLVIDGVVLLGGAVPVEITVPSALGHHVLDGTEVFDVVSSPIPGLVLTGATQVQVAP